MEMDTFALTENRHVLVENQQDSQGNWLVMDTVENKMFYVAPTQEVIDFFTPPDPHQTLSDNLEPNDEYDEDATTSSTTMSVPLIGKWNRQAILTLIQLYKNNFHRICGTSVKNAIVWRDITEALHAKGFTYTKKQVENKFKYLKQKYIKKKDNMGDKSTGASPIAFDYFDEFNDIFGDKPSVNPTSIASSSHESDADFEEGESQRKKIKISRNEKELSMLLEEFRQRDKAKREEKERRHKERQVLTERAISSFETIMNKLIDKI